MSEEQRLNNIATKCRGFLVNYHHVSRRKETMRLIRELHELTEPQPPPTLGVHVSDGVGAGDKLRGI